MTTLLRLVLPTIALFTLSGCAMFGPTPIKTVEVKVPVVIIPPPPDLPAIEYRVDTLMDTSSAGEVAKAYVLDLTMSRRMNEICQTILDKYRDQSADFSGVSRELEGLSIQTDTTLPPR